jgi:two-component system OmpR family response regulator
MEKTPQLLVVDDDREIRELLAGFLAKHRFRLLTAGDGKEMGKALADRRIDLVVLDLMLPVLSREQLLDLTRGREATAFDRSIDSQISRLRRKLEPDSARPTLIKTVRSSGYVFTPTVERS